MIFPFNKEHCELFKDVVFLVQASHNEYHQLWANHYYEPRREATIIQSWDQINVGEMIQIGKLDKRPVCISIFYAKLNGKKVAFYEGTSQVVDHKMIRDWLEHFTLKTIRWDNNSRWANCDAMNFHLCLNALGIK